MAIRQALAKPKNMVTIRVLQAVTPPVAKEWIAQFGLDPDKHPENLTRSGPARSRHCSQPWLQRSPTAATITPQFITRISDAKATCSARLNPRCLKARTTGAIPVRNAYVMSSPFEREITCSGTAAKAQATPAARCVRQDWHDQRRRGRLVCALPPRAHRRGLDRLRHRAAWAQKRETGGGPRRPSGSTSPRRWRSCGKPVVTILAVRPGPDNGEWFHEDSGLRQARASRPWA